MEALPFPFDSLTRIPVEQADALRRWARALPFVRLAKASWLGGPVSVRFEAPFAPAPVSVHPQVGVLLQRNAARFAWVLSPALAGTVLERSLGGDVGDPLLGPLGEMERGVLTYAVARWVAPSQWTVAGIFSHAPALEEALSGGPLQSWPMHLQLGSRAYATQLLINPSLPAPAPPAAEADDLPVVCSIRAGLATLPVNAVAGLQRGDIVVPDAISVDGRGEGAVQIHLRGASRAFEAVRAAGSLTVVRRIEGEDTGVPHEGVEVSASIEGMEDLPVTLSVELARFELALADVAALAPGEVVRTGAPTEGRVTLRAGDRVVAIGELVVVGDEVGVRLTEVPPR